MSSYLVAFAVSEYSSVESDIDTRISIAARKDAITDDLTTYGLENIPGERKNFAIDRGLISEHT